MSVEDRVRSSLEQQAKRFEPSANHLDDVLRRARLGQDGPVLERPRVRRMVLIAAVFVLFIAAMVPLWIAFRGDVSQPPSPSSVPASAGPGAVPRCRGDQLSVHAIPTDGAAGNVLTPIVLTNASSDACSLAGYPRLRFLGRDGRDLGLHASDDPKDVGQIPPSPVPRAPFVLTAGAKAWFRLYSTDVVPPCTWVHEIAITPPGGTGTVTMRATPMRKLVFCTGVLSVTAATPSQLPG
jgi:hypothetical protein